MSSDPVKSSQYDGPWESTDSMYAVVECSTGEPVITGTANRPYLFTSKAEALAFIAERCEVRPVRVIVVSATVRYPPAKKYFTGTNLPSANASSCPAESAERSINHE